MSLHTHRSHAGPVAIRPVLAPHLQEIVESLAVGETAREAAARLFISPNTVKSRLKALYQQLGARDQAHAVAIAFRLGILRTTDEPNLQPVVIGGLNPDRLRTTINDLTALLRVAEKVPHRPDYQDLLREVAELAADPEADPHDALQQIARIAESAATSAADGPAVAAA
ncbi:helix-turn-helix transcriptional regulator [Actinoplanes sp. NPDC023936]|uniref:helix-turn-helix transcriptional regulator n=1 Tax=Actinoplanes sp. NPDC023936 TaxID=3154910 RepID=UPI003411DEC8